MANETMTLIQTVSVGAGGAAEITFSSIPATYTDLYIVLSARTSVATGTDNSALKINSSSASFIGRRLYGSGGGVGSDTSAGFFVDGASATSNSFGSTSFYIPNYAGATNKSISFDSVSETNAAEAYQSISAALWSNTSAITSVGFYLGGGTFVENSSASIYGVLKGSGGATVS